MVTHWGMSERLGPVAFRDGEDHPFLGREMAEPRRFSEHTAQVIDEEVSRLLRDASDRATALLQRASREARRLGQQAGRGRDARRRGHREADRAAQLQAAPACRGRSGLGRRGNAASWAVFRQTADARVRKGAIFLPALGPLQLVVTAPRRRRRVAGTALTLSAVWKGAGGESIQTPSFPCQRRVSDATECASSRYCVRGVCGRHVRPADRIWRTAGR